MFQNMLSDTGYALRVMKSRPWFTAVIILTLAVGIGVNTAMFSTLSAVMFRQLPYEEPEQIVMGRSTFSGNIGPNVSGYDLYDYREQNQTFSFLAAITSLTRRHTVLGAEELDRVEGCWVTWDIFKTLGVDPQIGRHFAPEEGQPGGPVNVVIISHDYWQSRFSGYTSAIGSSLLIDGNPFTVVGVMPPGFWFLYDVDIWRTTYLDGPWAGGRRWHNFQVVGRLNPDVSIDQAQADIDLICERLAQEYPETNENKGLLLTNLNEYITEGWQTRIFLLTAALGLVLLIACGNVASLLLARGTTRLNEMAVRSAIGASRGRLITQLLTESILSSVFAGVLGILLALSLQGLMLRIMPLHDLGITQLLIDSRVLLFAIILSLATGLIFGIIPAFRGTPRSLVEHLKSGTRSTEAAGSTRLRNGLVAIQMALSVLLLVGAGLLIRSYGRLMSVDPGFNEKNLLTAELQLPVSDYADPAQRIQFFDRLIRDMRTMPGIESAGLIDRLPLRDSGGDIYVWDADQPPVDPSQWQTAYVRLVFPGYFDAMEIPVAAGRGIEPTDTPGSKMIIVINQAMAETLFPEENAIGKRVAVDWGETMVFEVIGVVGNTRISHVSSTPYRSMYFPYSYNPASNMKIAIRTDGDPLALVHPLRDFLARYDRNIPLAEPMSMESIISDSLGAMRIITALLAVFSIVALFLASIGLYGVLAYFVNSRSHEIGIRMALGANAPQLIGMILSRGMLLVGIGLIVGIAGALGTNRLLQEFLYETGVGDVGTFVGVGLFLVVIALAACLLPSWRAAKVDPVIALQAE